MVDIDKQVAHWQRSAEEDFEAARDMVERGHIRHGLFFAHLAVEKALKARICETTRDLAPRVHSLFRLAEIAEIEVPERLKVPLGEIDSFQLESRYPDLSISPPPKQLALEAIRNTEEILNWLTAKS